MTLCFGSNEYLESLTNMDGGIEGVGIGFRSSPPLLNLQP
jgi:hypothetical protein